MKKMMMVLAVTLATSASFATQQRVCGSGKAFQVSQQALQVLTGINVELEEINTSGTAEQKQAVLKNLKALLNSELGLAIEIATANKEGARAIAQSESDAVVKALANVMSLATEMHLLTFEGQSAKLEGKADADAKLKRAEEIKVAGTAEAARLQSLGAAAVNQKANEVANLLDIEICNRVSESTAKKLK